MVPTSYHSFFSGAVDAAAALIGLLFVAISIAPHKLSGEAASTGFQVKAGMAFSVLVNALVLSLYALLPGENLATVSLVLAIVGFSSVLGLALVAAGDPLIRRPMIGLRFLLLAAVFVAQLLASFALSSKPHSTGPVDVFCTLAVVCLLIAIDRAWELLGADETGFIHLVVKALSGRYESARAAPQEDAGARAAPPRDESPQ